MLKVAKLFKNVKKAKDALKQNRFNRDATLKYILDLEILDTFLDNQK